MNCHSSAASLVLTTLAVLGLLGPAAAKDQVPFRGRLEGIFANTVISTNPPILSVLTTGTGRASHLGAFKFEMRHQVNLATQASTGNIQFIAADGDRLDAEFTGQAALPPTPGVLSVVETATVTGGTGRFAGATGRFTIDRSVFQAGTTTGSFDGTINFR
jgi:hypothetical protein